MTDWYEWREAPEGDFAVIGDPIAHSWSPKMFAAVGIRNDYCAIRVPLSEFGEAINRLVSAGYRGLNVTAPLKEVAYSWAAEADYATQRIGAANTLCLQTGRATNTDHLGFLRALVAHQMVSGTALVLGAGGTSRAVLVALEKLGFKIRLWNRTPSRAEALKAELNVAANVVDDADTEGVNLVVNATSAGRAGECPPVQWTTTPGLAFDVVYAHEATPFMEDAIQSGWRAVDGRQMLVEQAVASYNWWTGETLDKEVMASALERAS